MFVKQYRPILYSSCCPCLLVEIIGVDLHFRSAYVFNMVHSDVLSGITLLCGASPLASKLVMKQLRTYQKLAQDLREPYAKVHVGAPVLVKGRFKLPKPSYRNGGPEKSLTYITPIGSSRFLRALTLSRVVL